MVAGSYFSLNLLMGRPLLSKTIFFPSSNSFRCWKVYLNLPTIVFTKFSVLTFLSVGLNILPNSIPYSANIFFKSGRGVNSLKPTAALLAS